MRRVLIGLFAVGIVTLAVGGYMTSISEWHHGKPRDQKEAIQVKRKAIVVILSGGAVCIGSAIGIYAIGKRP